MILLIYKATDTESNQNIYSRVFNTFRP